MATQKLLKIYKASAGSGKTYSLTRQYLLFLFSGDTKAKNILGVTFTNKATAEMKSRIIKELALISAGEKEAQHADFLCEKLDISPEDLQKKATEKLTAILHDYSTFQISTIDSFFSRIIRSFVREMSLNSNYELVVNTDEILNEAVNELFLSLNEKSDLFKYLKEICLENINEKSEKWNPKKDIKSLAEEVFKETYKNFFLNGKNDKIYDKNTIGKVKTELKNFQTAFEKEMYSLAEEVKKVLEKHDLKEEDFKGKSRSVVASCLNNIPKKTYEKILTNRYLATFSDDVKIDDLREILAKIVEELKKLETYNSAILVLKKINTIGVLPDIQAKIKEFIERENLFPNSDTNEFIARIIKDSDAPFIYEKVGINLRHYMIDEFQDTSQLQWNNFAPLIKESLSNGNENLIVGDVKQSIYRFRNSDWELLGGKIQQEENIKNYITEETLDTNFRSFKYVVNFNNDFFEFLKTNALTGFEKVVNAYKDVYQKPNATEESGFVEVCFFEKDEFKQLATQAMVEKVRELLDDGFSFRDIAILTGKNSEITLAVKALTENDFPVISDQVADVKTASRAVKFLVAILNLLAFPATATEKDPNKLEVLYNFFALDGDENALEKALENCENDWLKVLFGDENVISKLSQCSLFELLEGLIFHFKLNENEQELPFVQAFMDEVFAFETRHGSDVGAFVEHWQEKKALQLSLPDGKNAQNAIRVMTVHSSKGLEFPAVIIPFCNWGDKDGNKNNKIWCQTENLSAPFNEIPYLPINESKEMGASVFSDFYQNEKTQKMIDLVNKTYVAFTRAQERLVIFSYEKDNEKGKCENLPFFLTNFTKKNGEVFGVKTKHKNNLSAQNEPTGIAYPTFGFNHKLNLRVKNMAEFIVEENPRQVRRNFGNLMHEILAGVEVFDDLKKKFDEAFLAGRISENEKNEMFEKLKNYIFEHKIENWFSSEFEILREREIFDGGEILRPDRVMISGKTAIIADYKFGFEKREIYVKQLEKYSQKLREMGFETQAFLCYIERNELVKI